jgi:hypothetical protein
MNIPTLIEFDEATRLFLLVFGVDLPLLVVAVKAGFIC